MLLDMLQKLTDRNSHNYIINYITMFGILLWDSKLNNNVDMRFQIIGFYH